MDADTNTACHIRERLHDDEITWWISCQGVKALLAERSQPSVGAAPPGLELQGLATSPCQPRVKHL